MAASGYELFILMFIRNLTSEQYQVEHLKTNFLYPITGMQPSLCLLVIDSCFLIHPTKFWLQTCIDLMQKTMQDATCSI